MVENEHCNFSIIFCEFEFKKNSDLETLPVRLTFSMIFSTPMLTWPRTSPPKILQRFSKEVKCHFGIIFPPFCNLGSEVCILSLNIRTRCFEPFEVLWTQLGVRLMDSASKFGRFYMTRVITGRTQKQLKFLFSTCWNEEPLNFAPKVENQTKSN